MLKHLITTLRPRQWLKNLIIFAPLVFSKGLFVPDRALLVIAAFAVFCGISGAVYLLNDLFDREKDRMHPVKKLRPLPSGQLSPQIAVIAFIIISSGALAGAFALDAQLGIYTSLYLITNIAYSTAFKNIVIVDVMMIAFGFVLRVLGGAAVIHVPTTPWLLMCTILLALFLGFAKRRHELVLLTNEAEGHRKVLEHYTPYFLDQMIMIVTACTVMSYALYTMSAETVANFGTTHLIYTIPFVLYGIFRYLYLVHLKDGGGSPTRILLTDKPLMVNILFWLVVCLLIIEGIV